MEYIIALMLAALGGLVFLNRKANNAEALNENLDSKNKVLDLQKFIDKNLASLESEKAKREQLDANLTAEKEKSADKDEILDFLNSDKPTDNK